MTTAELIAQLIACGTPARLVAEVSALTIEIARLTTELEFRIIQAAKDDARRKRDADRQQRKKENPRISTVIRGNTTLSQENPSNTKVVPVVEELKIRGIPRQADPAYTKKERKKEREESKHMPEQARARACKILLPEDFTFNEADREASRKAGWSAEKTETELMRFKDHALTHGRRCADWHAAWRNWVRSPFQAKQSNGGMNGHHHETVADKGRRLIANMDAALQSPPGSAGGDEGRDPNVISLPRQQGRLL